MITSFLLLDCCLLFKLCLWRARVSVYLGMFSTVLLDVLSFALSSQQVWNFLVFASWWTCLTNASKGKKSVYSGRDIHNCALVNLVCNSESTSCFSKMYASQSGQHGNWNHVHPGAGVCRCIYHEIRQQRLELHGGFSPLASRELNGGGWQNSCYQNYWIQDDACRTRRAPVLASSCQGPCFLW